jgi:O-Glycosyl hydrolase
MMNALRPLLRAAAVGLVACSSQPASPADPIPDPPPPVSVDATVAIDPSHTFQTIEGWGISVGSFTDPHVLNVPFDAVPPLEVPLSDQHQIADTLFRGIGLMRGRMGTQPRNIEPVNDNDDPNVTDLSKFDFSGRKNDTFMDIAGDLRSRGMTRWWLSPNAFETWMNEDNAAEYVEWAMAIIRRWRDNGLELSYYSIANEPAGIGGPAGNAEYLRHVVTLLGRALKAEGFATRIVVPDDVNPTEAEARARVILADPEARQYVAALPFHLYGQPLTSIVPLKGLAEQYGIPLWMSEYYTQSPMEWALLVHFLLVDYNVSAVDYIAGYLGYDDGAELISIDHAGTRYLGYTIHGQFYFFGNYTKYVRPGAVRIAAGSTRSEDQASAFILGGHVTIVAINPGATPLNVRFDVASIPDHRAFSAVRSSDSEHLLSLPAPVLGDGGLVVTLPAVSITTLFQ